MSQSRWFRPTSHLTTAQPKERALINCTTTLHCTNTTLKIVFVAQTQTVFPNIPVWSAKATQMLQLPKGNQAESEICFCTLNFSAPYDLR